MSSWTRYEVLRDDGGTEIHVAPSTKSGQALAPHTLNPQCCCKPDGDVNEDGIEIWIHNDPRRSMH